MSKDFEVGGGDVLADLELADSEQERIKGELALHVHQLIKARGLKQDDAARMLRTTQQQISALRRIKPVSTSVGRLLEFLTLLGQDVEVVVKPAAPRQKKKGRISVSIEPPEACGETS